MARGFSFVGQTRYNLRQPKGGSSHFSTTRQTSSERLEYNHAHSAIDVVHCADRVVRWTIRSDVYPRFTALSQAQFSRSLRLYLLSPGGPDLFVSARVFVARFAERAQADRL